MLILQDLYIDLLHYTVDLLQLRPLCAHTHLAPCQLRLADQPPQPALQLLPPPVLHLLLPANQVQRVLWRRRVAALAHDLRVLSSQQLVQ